MSTCIVARRTVPYVGCVECRDRAARRLVETSAAGAALADLCRQDTLRRARLARRYWAARIEPVAKTLYDAARRPRSA